MTSTQMTNGTSEQSNGTLADSALTASAEVSTESWLPEEYRSDPSLTKYKNLNELVKGYKSANEMIGKSVRLPDPNNKEELDRFYNKLGRPEKPEGYKLTEDLKKGASEESIKEFLNRAHQTGMTDKQVEAVLSYNAELEKSKYDKMELERNEAETKLKELWGKDYDYKLSKVGSLLQVYKNKYGADAMDSLVAKAGNNVPFVVMLHDLATMLKGSKEDSHISGIGNTIFSGMSSEEAVNRIKEIRSNTSHPYHDDRHNEHRVAVKEMQDLYAIAYNDKK